MRTSEFKFELPEELIAQAPMADRDASRLMVVERESGRVLHRHFQDLLDYFRPDDVLVLNDSRVIPARLRGSNARSGGAFEMLLLEENGLNDWWCMLRPGKRARPGTEIIVHNAQGRKEDIRARVTEINDEGHRRLCFECQGNIKDKLESVGEVPLPPYIRRATSARLGPDRQRYQTVFARDGGSVAAPTAGLHFTPVLLERIKRLRVKVCFVTLHVGLGTFAPVKVEQLYDHKMHEERFNVPVETARAVSAAKRSNHRIIAVGTTTLRVLESLAVQPSTGPSSGLIRPGPGRTSIFIYPPFHFRVVDMLLTNFHLPCSTLLMLASAFAAPDETRGREVILAAYGVAVAERYRFFSYGDAMLIV